MIGWGAFPRATNHMRRAAQERRSKQTWPVNTASKIVMRIYNEQGEPKNTTLKAQRETLRLQPYDRLYNKNGHKNHQTSDNTTTNAP